MVLRTVIVLVVAVSVLGGCGRRGSLRAPDDPNAPAAAATSSGPGLGISPLDPGTSANDLRRDSDPAVTPTPAPGRKRPSMFDVIL